MKCAEELKQNKYPCTESKCSYWLDFEEDQNCTFICVDKNGPLTLRETAARLGVSYVRIQQIEQRALKKMEKFLDME